MTIKYYQMNEGPALVSIDEKLAFILVLYILEYVVVCPNAKSSTVTWCYVVV